MAHSEAGIYLKKAVLEAGGYNANAKWRAAEAGLYACAASYASLLSLNINNEKT